jgi:hypothetical protein
VVKGVVTHLALNLSGAVEVWKLGENVVDWCTGAVTLRIRELVAWAGAEKDVMPSSRRFSLQSTKSP